MVYCLGKSVTVGMNVRPKSSKLIAAVLSGLLERLQVNSEQKLLRVQAVPTSLTSQGE